MSKVVVLVGSVRKGGNTDLLARSFADGAGKDNDVEIISVADVKVNPCRGCNACLSTEGNLCIQKDDMSWIYGKLAEADVLVIASPVYFYGISSQLKAVIDRLHAPVRNTFGIKRLGLLLVGAAELPDLFDSILSQYELVLRFFRLESIGEVFVRGVKDVGDIEGDPALDKAYELGASLR
jgi:NAD(P)H-dependent FMN reductase